MKKSLGVFLWQIAVALYLLANGVLGLNKGGDFGVMFRAVFKGDVGVLVIIASVISLVAGVLVLMELFNIKVSFLDTLLIIIAIIWVVFIIFEIIGWIGGNQDFWLVLQKLAVHLMVCSSLLVASGKFD